MAETCKAAYRSPRADPAAWIIRDQSAELVIVLLELDGPAAEEVDEEVRVVRQPEIKAHKAVCGSFAPR